MALQLTLLSLCYWRSYSTGCNIALLVSLLPTAKMNCKIRRSKGRVKTKKCYKFNKALNRPRKHHIPIAKKILATDHYLKQGRMAPEIENELGILASSVKRIAGQARQRAKENRRPLEDISNYQEGSGKGRKKVFTFKQADALADYIISFCIN